MKKKGIILDFDGTIIDSTQEGVELCCKTAVIHKLPVPDGMKEYIRTLWGRPAHELIKICWPTANAEEFLKTWEELDAEQPISIFPGIKKVLPILAQNYTLSILTSRHKKAVHTQLAFHDLHAFFSFVYALEDCPVPKPDPKSIFPLLQKYEESGIGKDALLIVGDSVYADMALARAVDIDFIGVAWGHSSREDFQNAGVYKERVADSAEKLARIILNFA